MKTVVVPSSRKNTAGELIDDLDFTVFHYVIDILLKELMGDDSLSDIVNVLEVSVIIDACGVFTVFILARDQEALLPQNPFQVGYALLCEGDVLALFINAVITLFIEGGNRILIHHLKLGKLVVITGCGILLALLEEGDYAVRSADALRVILCLTGDDERRSCLIDEDRVDLIDDTEVMFGLDLVLKPPLHVVTQVVETKFVIRSVGDVACVSLTLPFIVLGGKDDTYCQTEVFINGSHPVAVTLRKIVVDRDDVNAFA